MPWARISLDSPREAVHLYNAVHSYCTTRAAWYEEHSQPLAAHDLLEFKDRFLAALDVLDRTNGQAIV